MFFSAKKHEPSNLVPDFFGETLEESPKLETICQKSANVQQQKTHKRHQQEKFRKLKQNGRQIKRTLGKKLERSTRKIGLAAERI